MNYNQIRTILLASMTATMSGADAVVPFLWGPPGVGKSACVKEVAHLMAKKLGLRGVLELGDKPEPGYKASEYFGLHDLRLSQADAVEVGGFPDKDVERGVMTRTLGDWFPSRDRTDIPVFGILFLDEWTSAPQTVQAASYQLTSDRRLANKPMMDGWMIVGAGNRIGDNGVVFKQPLPLSNRMAHFDFNSCIDTFIAWGQTDNRIPAWITSFLQFRPDLLNTFEKHIETKAQGHAFGTERSWDKYAQICTTVGEDTPELIRHFAHAYLGAGVATEAMAFRDTWESLPNIAYVLANPTKADVPTKSNIIYATCGALAASVTPDTMPALITYLERFSQRAFVTLCLTDSIRRNRANATTKAYNDWAVNNVHTLI